MNVIKKIVLLCLIKFGYSTDWCHLNCFNSELNIVCVQKNQCNPPWPCANVSLDQDGIVDEHNELRNKFAIGEERATGGIRVSNMMAVKWDDDLAYTAKCNMADCGDLKGDLCHRTSKFLVVGQNQWSVSGLSNVDCAEMAIEGVQRWYNEVVHVSLNEIKEDAQAYQGNIKTRRFTQLIWAKTTHVGCAMTKKTDDMGFIKCMMTCNYGPGVAIKSRAFHEGLPCSECPDPFCTQNGGLCWIPEKRERKNIGTSMNPNDVLLIIFTYLFLIISFIK